MRVRVLICLLLLAPAAAWGQGLLLNEKDFERINRLAGSQAWAAGVRGETIDTAGQWPAAHNARYGLTEWVVPPEGGQWSQWYVCPVHGAALQYALPGKHTCPIDKQVFTGWPYDQTIYTRRHTEAARAARDNALAWRLTGKTEYARAAAKILLAYADVYNSYPLHDVNGKPEPRTGARVGAQTLDESVWLIPVAWAYDLISGSGVLTGAERAHIEEDLLRAAAAVILRYDAGTSNWQSWHNAAIGAVGLAIGDRDLTERAIDGPSGFRFQMRKSVFDDGLWYEGAWGYHFYALDPLYTLAEMGWRAGYDLYGELSLRKMFEAPLRFALPNWTLPAFNDSGATQVLTNDRFFEVAFARYADPLFAAVLGRRARGREALFWGAESLPASSPEPPRASALFEASGYAALRAASNDHTLILKFGPHGGGHGHYDKLNFISFARGDTMAVDPGTQSYAAPTHNTWDKTTVAHNTVVVDERTQAEATGKLLAFAALPEMSAVRADAGPAYRQAALDRTIYLTGDYAVDVVAARSLDGQEHLYDWVYHNYGRLSTPLGLAPYAELPKANGYQHLTESRAAATAQDWQAVFDMNANLAATYGSVWASVAAVRGTFEYSREQSVSGRWAGRMKSDFSGGDGYLLCSMPALAGMPAEKPRGVSMMIHGDGSGQKLAIRLYDTTDERFVYTVGAVDWTGWRRIAATEPEKWSHYLGNNDGVFDGPVRTVALDIASVAGAARQSTIYADDITLDFPEAGEVLVTDFERVSRFLRVWMLGAAGTTVVTGNGIGPDLTKPVPFVMARRRGLEARFVTLLEPYGEESRVTGFRALGPQSFEVTGPGFADTFSLDDAGALRYRRDGR
ncbi:MAG: heparinase II/III family protein [Acidobacteria bacterium]|nr:heparinase II/III family protein [Acidobacteriota bacterium]